MKQKYHYGLGALVAIGLLAASSVYFNDGSEDYFNGWRDVPPLMTGQGEGYVRLMWELEAARGKEGEEAKLLQAASLRAALGMRLAEAAQKEKDPEKMRVALEHGAAATAFQPNNPSHWVVLGNIHLLAGAFDPMDATEAPVLFTRALEINPLFTPALLAMGQWHFDKMQYNRSLPYFETLVERDARHLSQDWFLSMLTSNYILAGKADIGAVKLAKTAGAGKKQQQAVAILKRESTQSDF